jgi:hypothetical protein
MGVNAKWGYTNNMQTEGKGSPFLSEEVTKFLRALRRQEVRDVNFAAKMYHPINCREYCKFEKTMARHLLRQFDHLIAACKEHVRRLG